MKNDKLGVLPHLIKPVLCGVESQLPPVARNDFLHPIEVDFLGFKNSGENGGVDLISQCFYCCLRCSLATGRGFEKVIPAG